MRPPLPSLAALRSRVEVQRAELAAMRAKVQRLNDHIAKKTQVLNRLQAQLATCGGVASVATADE